MLLRLRNTYEETEDLVDTGDEHFEHYQYQEAHQLVGQAKPRATKIPPKTVGIVFRTSICADRNQLTTSYQVQL